MAQDKVVRLLWKGDHVRGLGPEHHLIPGKITSVPIDVLEKFDGHFELEEFAKAGKLVNLDEVSKKKAAQLEAEAKAEEEKIKKGSAEAVKRAEAKAKATAEGEPEAEASADEIAAALAKVK
jgi:flagellar biosynthesis/type III secretory pathway protein FliH